MIPARRQQPFTLLEVVIAVSLLTVVIGTLAIGSFVVIDSWERLERHHQSFQQFMLLERTVDSILPNLIPFSWPNEDGADTLHFYGERDAMVGAYIHPFNRLEDGAIRFCGLFLEDDELVAYYCEHPPYPEDNGDDRLRRSVLSREVAEITFRYADLEEGEIVFVEAWEDRDYLPLAVWIRVTWRNDIHADWLRRTAASSYYERWGKWEQKRIQ